MVKPLCQVPWLLQCEYLFHKARSMNLEHGLHNHEVSGIMIGNSLQYGRFRLCYTPRDHESYRTEDSWR
ncbi:hypothetical protein J6590_068177 [Homalodisca vitripennis]|nr:hypothetical protein J6590_068177 [Homalodisca vitripennis]